MDTITVMIDDLLVSVPLAAWEASLQVEKWRRSAFLAAQAVRGTGLLCGPGSLACSPAENVGDSGKTGMR